MSALHLKRTSSCPARHQQSCQYCTHVIAWTTDLLTGHFIACCVLPLQLTGLDIWSGNLSKSAEIDGMLMINTAAIMLSAKRQHSQQNWHGSFLQHLSHINKEWKMVPHKLRQGLEQAETIHLIAGSADQGCIPDTAQQKSSLGPIADSWQL